MRKVWGGKAQLEEIEADGPNGHWEALTLFLYNPSAHQWSQSFVNSKVGTLSLSSTNVGEFKDGRVVLVGQDNTVSDKTILVKAVWSDIKSDSHQYEEWYSNDAGTTSGPVVYRQLDEVEIVSTTPPVVVHRCIDRYEHR